jgi:hypothetical protein
MSSALSCRGDGPDADEGGRTYTTAIDLATLLHGTQGYMLEVERGAPLTYPGVALAEVDGDGFAAVSIAAATGGIGGRRFLGRSSGFSGTSPAPWPR